MLPDHRGFFQPRGRGRRRIAAGRLKVPLVVENRYVLKLRRILQAVHAELNQHAAFHQDAADKLTPNQVVLLKTAHTTPSRHRSSSFLALERRGLIESTDRNWRQTNAGQALLGQLEAEPLELAGVRVIRAMRGPVQKAFDEMAAGVQRANRTALVEIGPSDLRLGDQLQQFRDKNIALMENAGREYAQRVREILDDPENAGARVESLADQLKQVQGVSESRAELIARDQTLKLNGQINQTRQENAGISQYTWSTAHDARVRDSHAELDGQVFSWSDPPEVDGELTSPGQQYQCRCVGIPYFGLVDTE